MSPRAAPTRTLAAALLGLCTLLAGCAHATATDLRQGSLSGHLAFEADDTVGDVLANLEELAARCLMKESGVVARAPGEAPGSLTVTYGFTDFGAYVTTVAVDLSPRPDGRSDVAIHYSPHPTDRWKKYAEKSRRWALRQADDCAF